MESNVSLSLFSPMALTTPSPSPHWPSLDNALGAMLPQAASMASPSPFSRSLADHQQHPPQPPALVLRDSSLSSVSFHNHHQSKTSTTFGSTSGAVTPIQSLTPLHSPLTPSLVPPPLASIGLLRDLSSNGMLDLLNPNSTTRNVTDASPLDGLHDGHKQQHVDKNNMEDGEEEEEEEEEEEDDNRSIDLEEASTTHADERRGGTSSSSSLSQRGLSDGGRPRPEQQDQHANQEAEEDDDSDDETTSLTEWVCESRRQGATAESVLQRLMADYADVLPSSSSCQRLLWKAALRLSAHLQEHLQRDEAARRPRLQHINSITDVLRLIQASSKIVVLTGAGISVSAGIPDFRSRGGIYPRLRKEFGMSSPEAMFDLAYFKNNPAIFYNFAKELWPGAHQPTVAHRFIRLLEQKGKLLRNYSQNIDALETRAGIQRALQCHGSFAAARCMSCRRQFPGKALHADIMQQRIPKCPSCHPPDADHTFDSIDDIGEDGLDRSCKTFGVIKPEITFFGESLPEAFRTSLEADRHEADLILVMGSSLKVRPVAGMLSFFPRSTPMLLINRETVGAPDTEFDVEMLGLADDICAYITQQLGWKLPEVDSKLDMFREESPSPADGVKGVEVAAGAASAASNLEPPSLPVSSSPPPLPRPSTPEFVLPNRYIFAGASVSVAQSGSSAASSGASEGEEEEDALASVPLSPEIASSPLPAARSTAAVPADLQLPQSSAAALSSLDLVDVLPAPQQNGYSVAQPPISAVTTPSGLLPLSTLSAPSTPRKGATTLPPQLSSPLHTAMGSPRTRLARPPPLQLASSDRHAAAALPLSSAAAASASDAAAAGHSSVASAAAAHPHPHGHGPAHSGVAELNLTCTPTKGICARACSHGGGGASGAATNSSPHFRALPFQAAISTVAHHPHPHHHPALHGSSPSTTHAAIPAAPVSLCNGASANGSANGVSSAAASPSASASVTLIGCKRKEPAAGMASVAQAQQTTQQQVQTPAASPPAPASETIHAPLVKRRRTEPEQKQEA